MIAVEVCFVEAAGTRSVDYTVFVCRLIERGYERGERALVLCPDRARAEALDRSLWSFDPDSFVPHGLIDQASAKTPVLLVPPEHRFSAEGGPVVYNLRPAAVAEAGRVIEPIPPDEPGKAAARERWRAYQRAGHSPRLERIEVSTA